MSEFHLQIVTPDGISFDSQAERIIVRTENGDVAILKNHANYVSNIGEGTTKILIDGIEKIGKCSGGIISVTKSVTRVLTNEFTWIEK